MKRVEQTADVSGKIKAVCKTSGKDFWWDQKIPAE